VPAARRPSHKTGHPECPHANWADCDSAQKIVFGQCKAVVGDKEPVPCTRWAVGENGWCWQHYASETEKVKRESRSAEARVELNERIDSYIAMSSEDPWFWLRYLKSADESTRGLAGVAGGEGVEPSLTRVTAEGLTTKRPAKVSSKPFRLTEPA
jgi:hypothetical protein